MATRYAVANSTDWGSTASWSSSAGGAGGASVPVSGDTVNIQAPVQFSLNMDQSAVTLAGLKVTSGMSSGYIGTVSAPLKIGVDNAGNNAFFNYAGVGVLYYYAGTDGCNYFQPLNGCGNVYLLGGTITQIQTGNSGGIVTLNGVSVTTLYCNGMGVSVLSPTGGGNLGTTYVSGGNVTITNSASGSAGVLYVYGGQLTVTGLGGITSAQVFNGGKLVVQCAAGIQAGGIGTLIGYPGSKTVATGSPYSFTVTNSARFIGATMFDNETITVTYTNPTTKAGYL